MSGLLLIALGVVFLGFNLYGLAFLRRASVVLDWLSIYWPVLLVVWGVLKIVQRLRAPERSRVGALEVVALVLFVLVGLTLSSGRRALERLSREGELTDLLAAVGPELLGPRHAFVETESFPLSADGPRRLLVENRRGTVRVTGWGEDRIEVELVKRLHAPSESAARTAADGLSLRLQEGPGDVENDEDEEDADDEVDGRVRQHLSVEGTRPHTVETELVLRVPRDVAVEIRTDRGRIEVSDLDSDVRLRTNDAAIEAARVRGSVRARTTRGAIYLSAIGGNAAAANRRGDVHARDIGGDLEASTSRGALVAEGVSGNATVTNRRGDVRVARTGGSLTVDGSESNVSVDSVGARLTVDAAGGTLFARGIGADVEIRARRTSIQLIAIQGSVTVEGSDAPTTLTGVAGAVRIAARQSDVRAFDVGSAITIESAADVGVWGFASDLTVTTRHGDIRVDTSELGGDVSLRSSYGDVELSLPREASARLEARTEDGGLESGHEAFESEPRDEGGERRWVGRLGDGSRLVALTSDHGDISFAVREP